LRGKEKERQLATAFLFFLLSYFPQKSKGRGLSGK